MGGGVPSWVERDFRAYLRCGISSGDAMSPRRAPAQGRPPTHPSSWQKLQPRTGARGWPDGLAVYGR